VRNILSRSSLVALATTLVLFAGCQKKEETVDNSQSSSTSAQTTTPSTAAPDSAGMEAAKRDATAQPPLPAGHIEVQHVLIGFVGTIPGKNITRSQEEAKKLAYEILDRAKKGEDFGQLVQKYTDDQYPGIYRLADRGQTADQSAGEFPRDGMVKGFSNTAFSLKVGDVGIADYNKPDSPYGWHIIKRLR
jgi:hypothetical protein